MKLKACLYCKCADRSEVGNTKECLNSIPLAVQCSRAKMLNEEQAMAASSSLSLLRRMLWTAGLVKNPKLWFLCCDPNKRHSWLPRGPLLVAGQWGWVQVSGLLPGNCCCACGNAAASAVGRSVLLSCCGGFISADLACFPGSGFTSAVISTCRNSPLQSWAA